MRLLDRLEPTLGSEEEGYRLHFLSVDRAQATGSVLIALALVLGVFVLELNYFGWPQILPIAIVRVLFFAFSGVLYLSVRGIENPAALDRASVIWTTAFAAQFVALTALRPPSKIDDVAIVVMVLGMYALAPTPLLKRAAPAIGLTIGFVLVLWLARGTPILQLWPNIAVLTAMNALGLFASARLHTQRRRQYQSQESLRASILERDALIDRLRQSHKMESMGRIVGGVAHDFNNILGTMLASVDFLLSELPENGTPRADAETIRAAVMRGADLTQQLLAFSRQQVLEPKVVSLNELVADTQRMLMRTIGEDIAIRVSLGEHLSSVRVDPGQVQQILLNLAVNARDAMPTGGTLAIQTRNATLDEPTPMSHSIADAGQYIMLTVSDDGTGMDATTLAQIFEPFFTTKPKGKGTGLGLATIYGIVKQSGGFVSFSSELQKGTAFQVHLPCADEPATMKSHSGVHPAAPKGTETILMIEDDDGVRRLGGRVLEMLGYTVLCAESGLQALDLARDHKGKIDLVLTDVVMPEMSGREVERRLAEAGHGARVLFMSGYTDDAILQHGVLESGVAFLQKPFTPATLGRKVREVLDTPG
jgi:signal transduction histidine kinase